MSKALWALGLWLLFVYGLHYAGVMLQTWAWNWMLKQSPRDEPSSERR